MGTLFALIYLYNVTKDRWNWERFGKFFLKVVPITFSTILLLVIIVWICGKYENETSDFLILFIVLCLQIFLLKRLTSEVWDWKKIIKFGIYVTSLIVIIFFGFYTYDKAISIYENIQKEARIKKEEIARDCNAQEILRIEPKLKENLRSLNAFTSIEEVTKVLNSLEPSSNQIVIPEDNIKTKMAVAVVKPKCNSEFRYLISATFNEDGFLDDYKTIARNPPLGYKVQSIKQASKFISIEDLPVPSSTKEENIDMVLSEFSINFRELAKQKTIQENETRVKSKFTWEEVLPDPFAPSLSRAERLKRLAQYGKIRELEDSEYHAANHMVKYFPQSAGGGFWECR